MARLAMTVHPEIDPFVKKPVHTSNIRVHVFRICRNKILFSVSLYGLLEGGKQAPPRKECTLCICAPVLEIIPRE